MSLHINKNTLRKKKKKTYTHTDTKRSTASEKKEKKNLFKKNTHTENWCAAMRSYEPEDCIEKNDKILLLILFMYVCMRIDICCCSL